MILEDIQRRYGGYIAKRLQTELNITDLADTDLAGLVDFLNERAEAAHRAYKKYLDNPLAAPHDATAKEKTGNLYNSWRDAEELAYLISVAESVHDTATAAKV